MRLKIISSIVTMLVLLSTHQIAKAEDKQNSSSGITIGLQKSETQYSANNKKKFNESADVFYRALLSNKYQKQVKSSLQYREYSNATWSIRKKVLFKDVGDFYYTVKDGEIQHNFPSSPTSFSPAPSPDRQVYFFASVKDEEKEFKGKYAIYDIETKQFWVGGTSYHYKKDYEKRHLDKKR